jgi:hypothetical protein
MNKQRWLDTKLGRIFIETCNSNLKKGQTKATLALFFGMTAKSLNNILQSKREPTSEY